MITTLTQLLQNPTMLGDKKLYSEWHVKQAWELQQSIIDGQKERIEVLTKALQAIKDLGNQNTATKYGMIEMHVIATNALNQTKP